MISEIKTLFDEWIAAVARAVDFGMRGCTRGRRILLSEVGDHTFTAKMVSVPKGPALPEVSFVLFAWQAQSSVDGELGGGVSRQPCGSSR